MLNKLEELKRQGAYSISLKFGEGMGCDDLDVPLDERKILVITAPVGHLGSQRNLFVGNVKSFKEFDISTKPKVISNPPKTEEYQDNGYYTWGA